MRKNRSQFISAKYPNLYRYPDQPCWIFRKYSSEKRREFYCSTGVESNERSAAQAYRVGVEKFNEWMGSHLSMGGPIYVRDLARALLAEKDDPELSDSTLRGARNQIENHILPAFGHLKPEAVTAERWREYKRTERKRPRELVLKSGVVKTLPPRKALFNTRKILSEVLSLALEKGLIKKLPDLELGDPEAAPPRYIPKADVLRIIRAAGKIAAYTRANGRSAPESRYRAVRLKLLVFIMWKQGPRPSEALQYTWPMIHWTEGEHGSIHIPAAITKTRRARIIPLNQKVSRVLRKLEAVRLGSDWIFPSTKRPGQRWKEYDTAWSTVMRRLGMDYGVYNLRDTWITDRLEAGLSPTFIGKYCDNSATIIERRYAVAKRNIMERVAG